MMSTVRSQLTRLAILVSATGMVALSQSATPPAGLLDRLVANAQSAGDTKSVQRLSNLKTALTIRQTLRPQGDSLR